MMVVPGRMMDPSEALQRMRLAGFQVDIHPEGGLRVEPRKRLSAEQQDFVATHRDALECAVLREALLRQAQAMREAAQEMAEMRSELDDYRELVTVLEGRLEERVAKTSRNRSAASIPAGMLRRLIQLCHPDRHGDSDASRKATTYLLGLRDGGSS